MLATIFGYTAAVTMVLGYLPQTIKTIKTRSTDDIAMGSFLLMAIGATCFSVQGFMLNNIPLAITNTLTASMSAVIFGIKISNDIRKRKQK